MLRWAKVFVMGATIWLACAGPTQPAWAAPRFGEAKAPAVVAARAPLEIPEPVTLILFGTGLAAMAAASTVKRKR